jgi:ubiquinone/menaquinone biosynthesis C-methylase UbiE
MDGRYWLPEELKEGKNLQFPTNLWIRNNSISLNWIMRVPERFCLFLNKGLPKLKVSGRESFQSYCNAQYRWAQTSYALHSKYLDLEGKIVLDAGCGMGGKTTFYAEKGCKLIIGIDIAENSLESARAFAKEKQIQNVEFIHGSLDSMPFESDKFDVIIMNDAIEHISRPILIKALEECKRVIKPGGRICLEFPPWSSFDASHLYDYINIPWCQLFFSQKTLINVMKSMNPNQEVVGISSLIEQYQELNRITIKEFKGIVKKLRFNVIAIDLNMVFNLKFFKYIPILNKYWTRRVVGVLSKPGLITPQF